MPKAMSRITLLLSVAFLLLTGAIATGTESQSVGPVAGDKASPADDRGDLRKLQGKWYAVEVERDGKAIREDPRSFTVTIAEEMIGFEVIPKNKFRLRTDRSPRELEMILAEGKGKGQTLRLIYAVEDDSLKIIMPLGPKSARATEFKTKPGDGLLLAVFRRADQDKAAGQDDDTTVKREWRRADVPPDGNYRLAYVDAREHTCCLIRLETTDGKPAVRLLDASDAFELTAVTTAFSPEPAGGVKVRLECLGPRGNLVFDGSLPRGALEARGCLEFVT